MQNQPGFLHNQPGFDINMKRYREQKFDSNQPEEKRARTKDKQISYYTPLEQKIYDELYNLTQMIQTDSTKSEKFELTKNKLQELNKKLLGQQKLLNQCQSTRFLEFLIDFESVKLNQKEKQLYKSNVLDIWNQYMKANFLPYLNGPVSILKRISVENDDQELAAIMTFVKYQWDVLYGGCPYPKDPYSGEHYNMIGFLLGKNECHCTCITALLIVSADCLGLFPDFIFAQHTAGHVYVVTHRGLAIEGAGTAASDIIIGDKPHGPTSYALRSPEDFVQKIGWFTGHSRSDIRKKGTLDIMKKTFGMDKRETFAEALDNHETSPTLSDKDFVLQWIHMFGQIRIFMQFYKDPLFLRLYDEYLLLYKKYHDSHLFKDNLEIPTVFVVDNSNLSSAASIFHEKIMTDKESQTKKYRMLFFLTILFLNVDGDYFGDMIDFDDNNGSSNNENENNDYQPDGTEEHKWLLDMVKDYARSFLDEAKAICNTFTEDLSMDRMSGVTKSAVFKQAAYENMKLILDLWKIINDRASNQNDRIPIPLIRQLENLIKSCF